MPACNVSRLWPRAVMIATGRCFSQAWAKSGHEGACHALVGAETAFATSSTKYCSWPGFSLSGEMSRKWL
jgi:hypothetical protein